MKFSVIYVDSNSNNSIFLGNHQFPFKNLEMAFISVIQNNETNNEIILLSSEFPYFLNRNFSFMNQTNFRLTSNNNVANLVFYPFAINDFFFATILIVENDSNLKMEKIFILNQELQSKIFHLQNLEFALFTSSIFSFNKINADFIFFANISLINFHNSTFNNNYLNNSIFFNIMNTSFILLNCNFENNIMNSEIKFFQKIGIVNQIFNLSYCHIKNNSFYNQVFFKLGSEKHVLINIANSEFVENSGTSDIPLFFHLSESQGFFVIEQMNISKNYALKSFILIEEFAGNILITNQFIVNNFGNGLINIANSKNVVIKNCIFSMNNIDDKMFKTIILNNKFSGPAIIILEFLTLLIDSLEISESYAISNIPGLVLKQSYLIFNLDNLVLNNNENLENIGNCLNFNMDYKIEISNSHFLRNKINVKLFSQYGGNPCLYTSNSNSIIFISYSQFLGNMAFSNGNCINFIGKQLSVNYSSFKEQSFITSKAFLDNTGGAINMGGENLILNNVEIEFNKAAKGAGIYFRNPLSIYQIFTCSRIKINFNSGIQTSAIEFDVTLFLGFFNMTNSQIIGNSVTFYAVISTLYASDFYIYFNNCIFKENYGTASGSVYGAFHFGGLVFFNNSIFEKNKVEINPFVGGSVGLFYGSGVSTICFYKNCTYIENYSSKKAGVHAVLFGQVYEEDCHYYNNSALFAGAVLVTMYASYNLSNGFIYNSTSTYGGIFIFTDASKINLFNNIYEFNSAEIGACMAIEGFNIDLNVINCSFSNNYGSEGTIIKITNSKLKSSIFKNCNFNNNFANISHFHGGHAQLNIVNTNFTRNYGRIFLINDIFIIFNYVFIEYEYYDIENLEGLIMETGENSLILINNIQISFIESINFKFIFKIKNSEFKISNISFFNIRNNAILIYSFNSYVIFSDSKLKDLKNQLIYSHTNFLLSINNLILESFVADNLINSVIECFQCLNLEIKNSLIINITSFVNVLKIASQTLINLNDFLIFNCSFSNCLSNFGGAIYVENHNIKIFNSFFQENKAIKGGAIYFTCKDKSNCNWDLQNNTFIRNKAQQGGAIHSNTKIPLNLFLNKFFNNEAKYGQNYSSFPVRLGHLKNINNTNIIFYCEENCSNSFEASGQPFTDLKFVILDTYNQIVTLAEGNAVIDISYENLENTNESYDLRGLLISKSINGIFNFEKSFLIGKPNTSVNLTISTDLIQNINSQFVKSNSYHIQNNKTNKYNLLIPINLRLCIRGEIYMPENNICFKCPKGKYSLKVEDKECFDCPENAYCDLGGDQLELKFGFWRSSDSSDKIYECNSVSYPCLGGINITCSAGHTGILCGSCLFNEEDKYFKKGMYICEKCNNLYYYMIILIFFLIFIFGLISFLILSKKGADQTNYLLVKMITTHFQTISFLVNVKIELPSFLIQVNSVQAPLTNSDSLFFTLDCFRDSFESLFVMKLILSIIVLLFILIIVGSIIIFQGKRKKTPKKIIIGDFIHALIVIASFFQPAFINFYIQNLSCDKIDEKQYLTFNLEQECWNNTHLIFSMIITVPLLIFLMILYPAYFYFYMKKNKNNLNQPNIFKLTRFFLIGYDDKYYYWEFVQMSRKFIIIIIATFLRNNKEVAVYSLVLIIGFFFFLQLFNSPYVKKNHNYLENLSLNACFITYYCILFFLRNLSEIEKIVFVLLILTFNILFFGFWIKEYLILLKSKAKEIVMKLSSFKKSKISINSIRKNAKSISSTSKKLKIKSKK